MSAGRRVARVLGRRGNAGGISWSMWRRLISLGNLGRDLTRLWGVEVRAPYFEAEILAASFVCAAALAGSGGNDLVFAAAVGGVATVFIFAFPETSWVGPDSVNVNIWAGSWYCSSSKSRYYSSYIAFSLMMEAAFCLKLVVFSH